MSNETKNTALGMNYSTASAQLKKNLMFKFMQVLELDKCFRCGLVIETPDAMSVEHKEAWLQAENPKEAFFDLNNIAFSHLNPCNTGAASHPKRLTEDERTIVQQQIKDRNRTYQKDNRDRLNGYQRSDVVREQKLAWYYRNKDVVGPKQAEYKRKLRSRSSMDE